MQHPVFCNLCNKPHTVGITRVLRLLIFDFCRRCHRQRRSECDSLMQQVVANW